MKILFFGDIIGRPGREGLARVLPRLLKEEGVDFVIANAENAAGGKGLTPKIAEELLALGVDCLTMGNHTFDRKEIEHIIEDPRILRPANYAVGVPGHGWHVYRSRSGTPVGVFQVMGRVYMPLTDCPFRTSDRVLRDLSSNARVIVADLHCEITSEKQSLGWYLDGRVSAAIGTHTHVQTADERLLPGGTAYLTDAGGTGPLDSVIGMEKDIAVKRFLTGLKAPMVVARGDAVVCGCLVDVDETTGKARAVHRIREVVVRDPALAE